MQRSARKKLQRNNITSNKKTRSSERVFYFLVLQAFTCSVTEREEQQNAVIFLASKKLYCPWQLYLPMASDIAHSVRSCGYFQPQLTVGEYHVRRTNNSRSEYNCGFATISLVLHRKTNKKRSITLHFFQKHCAPTPTIHTEVETK